MQIFKNIKILLLNLIIFLLPFLDFIKNNLDEIDIIIGKSFYFLIFVISAIILISAYILNFFIKRINLMESILIICLSFWLLFKHNFLKISDLENKILEVNEKNKKLIFFT